MTDQSVSKIRRRRPDARPDEILDAALGLFAARGFDATRMEDVARAAGASKGVVYLYFPDKAALLKAVITKKAREHVLERTVEMMNPATSAAAAIRQFLIVLGETINTTSLPHILKLVIAESQAHPEIGKFYLETVIATLLPRLEMLISRGIAAGEFRAVDPALAARCTVGPMVMAAMWKAVFEPLGAPLGDATALACQHADIVIGGLAA